MAMHSIKVTSLFFVLQLATAVAVPPAAEGTGTQTLDLGGRWTCTNGTGTPFAATVPGQIHTDLLAAGLITEPFNGTNVDTQRWIAMADWTYSTNFTVTAAMLAHSHVQLISMGIDTVADVYINDKHALYTDNMFHRIRADIKQFLVEGRNTIEVRFVSKVIEANKRAAACETDSSIICPVRKMNPCQHPFQNVNYIRTEPCSFSWDWGPAYAPVGLWRSIYIQGFNSAVIRDITVVTTPRAASEDLMAHQHASRPDAADSFATDDTTDAAMIARAFQRTDRELDTSHWDLSVGVFVDAGIHTPFADLERKQSQAGAPVTGHVVVSLNGLGLTTSAPVTLAAGEEVRVNILLKNVAAKAWWPNGFGEQHVYVLSAKFVEGAEEQDTLLTPFEVDYPLDEATIKGADGRLSVRFGFREVELVQNPLPGGLSYFFKVNGVPIPVKGSNWIPADAFESRVSRNTSGTTRLEPLFVALRSSHQNMIRNWGGGIYQRDSFYDLADENGIMIWEDLMWACAKYAVAPRYLASAAQEIRDNVRRMQAHPSIALWAGNNENERDLKTLPSANRTLDSNPLLKAYSLLTFQTALDNVSALDTSRPLSGSSPSCGNETAERPWSWDHQSIYLGDVHCYLYDVDNWDATLYKRPRFMSEFGLQSWPSALTMAQVFPTDQWDYGSQMSLDRNHHPDGQSQMKQQISMHFHLPFTCNPASTSNCQLKQMYDGWAQTLWMTQLNQALGYKIEIEHFRRIRTDCPIEKSGCNMGRMFWQTNDIWQGASWAAVDYTGRYKMVQYFIQNVYEPILVSAHGSALHDTFAVTVINDHTSSDMLVHGELVMTMNSWATGALASWKAPFTAQPASADEVSSLTSTFSDMLKRGTCPGDDAASCFLTYTAYNGTREEGRVLSSNYLLLSPMFDVTTMRDPKLNVSSVETVGPEAAAVAGAVAHEEVFVVSIECAASVAFLWAETPLHGRWSDNGVFVADAGTIQLLWFSDTTRNGKVSPSQLHSTLQQGRWTNPATGVSKLALKPGSGAVWSLTDTSPEYMGG